MLIALVRVVQLIRFQNHFIQVVGILLSIVCSAGSAANASPGFCRNLFAGSFTVVQALEMELGPLHQRFQPAFAYLLKASELTWIAKEWSRENFSFAMNARSELRDKILERGFLNQYEVGQSGGKYAPSLREQMEATFLGMPLPEYQNKPYSERAKYGYLAPAHNSQIASIDASQYGNDIYRFKPEKIKDFLTLTAGDSLEIFQNVKDDLSSSGLHQQRFIPWKLKEFLLPFLRMESASKEVLAVQDGETARSAVTVNDREMMPASRVYDRGNTYYIELQIWKSLKIEDLESFSFKGDPPTGDFLEALKKNNVIIYERKYASAMDAFFKNNEVEEIWWKP